jgi:hypothetical protein
VIKSRRMRFAGHVARMGPIRNADKILVGKPGRKRPLGRTRRRREGVRKDYGNRVEKCGLDACGLG